MMEFEIRLSDGFFTVLRREGESYSEVAEGQYNMVALFHVGGKAFVAGVLGPGPTDRTKFPGPHETDDGFLSSGVYELEQKGCTIVDDPDFPPQESEDGMYDDEYEDEEYEDDEYEDDEYEDDEYEDEEDEEEES